MLSGDDVIWTVLIISNLAWAGWVMHLLMLAERKSVSQWETMQTPKKPQPQGVGKKKKKKEEETAETIKVKELKKKYDRCKNSRDQILKEIDEEHSNHEAMAGRLTRDLEKVTAKKEETLSQEALLIERIRKARERAGLLNDKMATTENSLEEEITKLEKLKTDAKDARDVFESVQMQSNEIEKAKKASLTKLHSQRREYAGKQSRVEGIGRKVERIERQNNFLQREIQRVTTRNAYKSGWNKYESRNHNNREDDWQASKPAFNNYPTDHNEPGSHHDDYYSDNEDIEAPKPHVSELLEKAMESSSRRWMDDDIEGGEWNTM
eukprot:TRINITY_DN16357_c0_g1_i1.p1 TRINITY_DN16357_c0_g1~~TRINITY_DN16357_c0_g1_i1.p1  ORF type:complete len:337 (+),score=98.99 TRINITY_DN16357_c0_g1_i1:46-1011(+)